MAWSAASAGSRQQASFIIYHLAAGSRQQQLDNYRLDNSHPDPSSHPDLAGNS
jgi:hypothetical protein